MNDYDLTDRINSGKLGSVPVLKEPIAHGEVRDRDSHTVAVCWNGNSHGGNVQDSRALHRPEAKAWKKLLVGWSASTRPASLQHARETEDD